MQFLDRTFAAVLLTLGISKSGSATQSKLTFHREYEVNFHKENSPVDNNMNFSLSFFQIVQRTVRKVAYNVCVYCCSCVCIFCFCFLL